MQEEMKRQQEDREYGFCTARKLTILQAKLRDVPDIVKLYQKNTAIERAEVWYNWEIMIKGRSKHKSLEEEIMNEEWIVFVIRDASKKVIGLLEADTDDGREFQIGIWIPNEAKRVSYAEHIKESFIDWICLGECPVEKITEVRVLEKMEKNPKDVKYATIAENIEFEDVEEAEEV